MKLIRALAAVVMAGLAVLSQTALAQTATSTFKVTVNLTPKCYVNIDTATPASQATTDVTLTYTAFQATDAQASTNFNVRCTNSWPYSIAVTPDTDSAAGITYFLKVAAGAAQYTNAAGGGSLGSLAGSGADQAYSVGVQANSGQAGTCAVAPCTGQKTHTITVTY